MTTATKEATLRVLDIVPGTSVDGPGLRTSIYFAGCDHRCPGCHNPQSWDMDGGEAMTIAEIADIVDRHGFNVTFTGGDPLMHPAELAQLAAELRSRGYNIWCFTGYRYEEIAGKELFHPLLRQIDVLVDSPFVLSQRDTTLRFRGSRNQRLIDIPATLEGGTPTLWDDADDDQDDLPAIPD